MMNWSLQGFALAVAAISRESATTARCIENSPNTQIAFGDKAQVDGSLQFAQEQIQRLNLTSARQRLERLLVRLRSSPYLSVGGTSFYTHEQLHRDLVTLTEAIEDDIKTEYFYHYPRNKAALIFQNGVWLPAFEAFPSTRPEAEAGIDCYALGHPTACAFHMMRVAELGMRALARERQVTFPRHPLEWAEWENIIDGIESSARAATNGWSRGPARDAARSFYTAAVAQLRAFKETRNRLMHTRGSFDDLDAQRAMNQVRDFMVGLSAKIGEKTRAPIRRWP
jgi:hypothetical protein